MSAVARCGLCETPLVVYTSALLAFPRYAAALFSAAEANHAKGCEVGALMDIHRVWTARPTKPRGKRR